MIFKFPNGEQQYKRYGAYPIGVISSNKEKPAKIIFDVDETDKFLNETDKIRANKNVNYLNMILNATRSVEFRVNKITPVAAFFSKINKKIDVVVMPNDNHQHNDKEE